MAYSTSNESHANIYRAEKLSMSGILHTCQIFNFIVYTILVGFCCIMGLVGNTISILVFRRERRNCAYSFLLQALAFADNGVLLISFPVLVIITGLLPLIDDIDVTVTSLTVQHYCRVYLNPIAYMAYTQTILVTCLLAVNRYIAVCKSLKAANLCTIKNVRIQLAVVTVISFLLNFPRFFQIQITRNINGTSVEETPIGRNSHFGIIYTNIVFSILIYVIPTAMLVVLNVKLVMALRTARHTRRRISVDQDLKTQSRTNEENLTKVMIIIILVFLLCNTPDRLQQILLLMFPIKRCEDALIKTHAICNFLIIVNSCSNFVIYYMWKTRFRNKVLNLFTGAASKTHTNVLTSNALVTERRRSSLTCLQQHAVSDR